MTRIKMIFTKDPNQRYEYQLARMSACLAFVSDVAMMLLGGKLKRKEAISARLGDVLSQLYISSATLKFFHEGGSLGNEQAFVDWNLQTALHKMQEAFYGVFLNFPVRGVGLLCRLTVFPFGRCYRAPSDKTIATLSEVMMTDTLVRSRLSSECYLSEAGNNPIAIVENAYQEQLRTQTIAKKIQESIRNGELSAVNDLHLLYTQAKTQGIINELEFKSLEKAEAARMQAIAVDEFAQQYFQQSTPACALADER